MLSTQSSWALPAVGAATLLLVLTAGVPARRIAAADHEIPGNASTQTLPEGDGGPEMDPAGTPGLPSTQGSTSLNGGPEMDPAGPPGVMYTSRAQTLEQ